MLNHLKHSEIDKLKWDTITLNSPNGLIYNLSSYLDTVSPNWEALILDDYKAILPLPVKKKGIKYLIQPNHIQKFFIVGENPDSETENSFLDYISLKYKYINIRIGTTNKDVALKNFHLRNTNFELALEKPYRELYMTFSKNHKKNIKSALNKNLEIKEFSDPLQFLKFTKSNLNNKIENNTDKFWSDMLTLVKMLYNTKTGHFLSVTDAYDKIVAIAFVANFKNRLYLLFNSATKSGREKRAHYFLLNHLISSYSNKSLILDFEGSNISSVAYFFEGFGGIKTVYYSFKINNLPWPVKLLKS